MTTLDEIQARADETAAFFSGPHDFMPTHYEDRAKLVAALRAVEDLATAWESRAAHDREYAKSVPAPIREDFLDFPATMEHHANLIRTAVREALG